MADPILSIITTVYNVRDYLPQTVQSILAQSFTDFELLLVDDGCPYGGGALCDQLAKLDPRIRVIHKPNGGPDLPPMRGWTKPGGGMWAL